jgi:PmbA protein
MIGKDKIFSTLEGVLKKSPAEQTEAVLIGTTSGLTRYANSTIHQNVAETDSKVYFRTLVGNRMGVASTNSFVPGDLKRTLLNSYYLAENQRENPDLPELPPKASYPKLQTYLKSTASFTPRQRADKVRRIVKKAAKYDLDIAGSFSTSQSEVAVVNSRGVRAYQPLTGASVNIIALSPDSSGYAEGLSRRVGDLDFEVIADTAIKKCLDSKNPQEIKPGRYDVILEPCAVGSIIEWLNYIAFGARQFHEGTSFVSGKIGKKVLGENITIYDDGNDGGGIAFPFDFEGVPKKRVYLIQKGIAEGVVHNSLTAIRDEVESTGHALTPEYPEDPMALNLFVKGGNSSLRRMISSVERGLLITRFHYINGYLDTTKALMTGMTRDGTFLIKEGKVKHGVKNLRFTDSMVRAFSNVVTLSRERQVINSWWQDIGCLVCPAMLVKNFNFSGKTEF